MIKTNEIKAEMKRAGINQKELAQEMKIDPSTLNRKINDSSGEKITVADANKMVEILKIPLKEAMNIFFGQELAKTQEHIERQTERRN